MTFFKFIKYVIKDKLKNLAHRISFISFRKASKRYQIWNRKRERSFLKRIEHFYIKSSLEFDSTLVSVIMPVYNRSYCIDTAIESLLNQTHTNWELIIIDDGSTDDLHEILKKYQSNEKIKLIQKKWEGVSISRNVGLSEAQGKYVFYLDTDNSWYENYLRTMIVFMTTGNLEVAYSGAEIIDDKHVVIGYYGEPFIWDECWELNHIDINGLGHKLPGKDSFLQFDETLKRLVDWDFTLRMTYLQRTSYAPFLGVIYYDGDQGNRITFTEYTGSELDTLKRQIQEKNFAKKGISQNSDKAIRPSWQQILS